MNIRERREAGGFVLLSFVRGPGERSLDDSIVKQAQVARRFRKVTMAEAEAYRRDVLKGQPPEKDIALFGNTGHGPADKGGLVGVLYISNENGQTGVFENWRRGNTLNKWHCTDWEFLFKE